MRVNHRTAARQPFLYRLEVAIDLRSTLHYSDAVTRRTITYMAEARRQSAYSDLAGLVLSANNNWSRPKSCFSSRTI